MQHYFNCHKQMFNIANTPCTTPHHTTTTTPTKETSLPDRWLQGRFDDAAMITGVRMNTHKYLLIREY
jgi:hypothetical protein